MSYIIVRIGVMDALLFAINLEVMLLQMRILESCAIRRYPKEKFRNKSEKQLCDKLQRDRRKLKDVCIKTLIDLIEHGEFYTLKQALSTLVNNANSGIYLRKRCEKFKSNLDSVTMEVQKYREHWTAELRNGDIKIAYLRDNIKDTALNSRFQFEYADKWLCARAETMELQMQEQPTTPPHLDNENCVHNEMLRAYTLQIKEREESLQNWKRRYAEDTSDINTRLADQCEKLRVTSTRRVDLESLYKLHEGEMRSWLTFKRERAARLAREERLRRAATRVQAWWRGVMVRRALGTFRYLRNIKKTAHKTKKK